MKLVKHSGLSTKEKSILFFRILYWNIENY